MSGLCPTICPICGWWNELNEVCIYHPESVVKKNEVQRL